MSIALATNQTADGASAATLDFAGGVGTFQVDEGSVWDGAEIVSLEYSPDGGTSWKDTGIAITAPHAKQGQNFELATPCKIRSLITGAGENTNMSTSING